MKTFDYNDYYTHCPLAADIESLVNDCGSPTTHLTKIKEYYEKNGMTPRDMHKFFTSCLGYWSEAKYYDDRNKYAVFGSRVIAEKFPSVKTSCKDDDILLNAYGFTLSAHRYLQNELFKTILEYYKQREDSVFTWWEEQDFVYDDDKLIPYEEYKNRQNL